MFADAADFQAKFGVDGAFSSDLWTFWTTLSVGTTETADAPACAVSAAAAAAVAAVLPFWRVLVRVWRIGAGLLACRSNASTFVLSGLLTYGLVGGFFFGKM